VSEYVQIFCMTQSLNINHYNYGFLQCSTTQTERKVGSDTYSTLKIEARSYYCSRTFLVYLYIRCARISYRRFIAIHYKFKCLTYIQELLVIGGVEYREI
jgi:hypothetical protein